MRALQPALDQIVHQHSYRHRTNASGYGCDMGNAFYRFVELDIPDDPSQPIICLDLINADIDYNLSLMEPVALEEGGTTDS